jgi:hypothetical protein
MPRYPSRTKGSESSTRLLATNAILLVGVQWFAILIEQLADRQRLLAIRLSLSAEPSGRIFQVFCSRESLFILRVRESRSHDLAGSFTEVTQ